MDDANRGAMGAALHEVTASRRRSLLALFPVLTVAAFLLPIVAGLIGTLLPAFGYLPAIGGRALGIEPWRRLFSYPGITTSIITTVATGFAATFISLVLALAFCGVAFGRTWARRIGGFVAPVLSTPHAAIAIGIAFLIAPSGWIARAISPWLTGGTTPPDISTVGDRTGWPLILCLVVKETPYLVLMIVGALHQVPAQGCMRVARSLGYGALVTWAKVIVPQIYPQIRLPIYAVLAFSLSVVDVALIVGPGNPPPLAVLAVRWFADPDIGRYFAAAAAASLQLAVVFVAIAIWRVAELMTKVSGRRWIARGRRESFIAPAARVAFGLTIGLWTLAIIAVMGMALWSIATQWRFPDALPSGWTLASWSRELASLAASVWTTLVVALAATALALVLVLGCLENETRIRHIAGNRVLWLLYVPLLVPQIAFLFGVQVLLVGAGIDGTLGAVVATHLVFVLPYVFLSLADPWRSLDPRYPRAAASLGASASRVFWRIRLPLLMHATLIAAAIGFAVSVGQYLPTIFAGSGRVATLTTDAVTLASGADRRVIGAYAILQAALPLLVYGAAVAIPAWRFRHHRAMSWD